jgi:pSer/pThr/pTyr-binding forkhead associated (FHA) protein
MDVKLVVEKGRTRTRAIRLRSAETLIGRRQDADLRILSSEVSRRHCVLRIEEEGYLTVEDLGSANGTFLNRSPVDGQEVVRPGDRLTIGPVTFVVEYQLTQAAIDRLEERSAGMEVVEIVEDIPEAELEDDLPLLDAIPDDDRQTAALAPTDDDFSVPLEDDVLQISDADELELPEGGELRDILSQLDEE